MTPQERIAIEQQLAGLRGDELRTVASAALAQCNDLECNNNVLGAALNRAGAMIPQHVGEGTRTALSVGTGALVGLARGTFGDLWGRVASAAPAIAGFAVGVASKDINAKAAGYSVMIGAATGEAAIELYDAGQILRAKMATKVEKGAAAPIPPAAQPTAQPTAKP